MWFFLVSSYLLTGFLRGTVDGGVGEGDVGEGRGCGFSEYDGRRIGMEFVGIKLLTNSSDSTCSLASIDYVCYTIS